MRIAELTRRAPRSRRRALADEIRERRLAECRRTVEAFVFGVGLLIAGHDAELDGCATRSVVTRMQGALEPFLSTGETMRPDFGSHGELRIDGDLLDLGKPLNAWVEFEDRSMRQSGGRLVPGPRRRIRIALKLSVQPCQVIDVTVRLSGVV